MSPSIQKGTKRSGLETLSKVKDNSNTTVGAQSKAQNQLALIQAEKESYTGTVVVVQESNTSSHCLEDTSANKLSIRGITKRPRLSLSLTKSATNSNTYQQQNTTTESKRLIATVLTPCQEYFKQEDVDPNNTQTTSTDLQTSNEQLAKVGNPNPPLLSSTHNQTTTTISQLQNTCTILATESTCIIGSAKPSNQTLSVTHNYRQTTYSSKSFTQVHMHNMQQILWISKQFVTT